MSPSATRPVLTLDAVADADPHAVGPIAHARAAQHAAGRRVRPTVVVSSDAVRGLKDGEGAAALAEAVVASGPTGAGVIAVRMGLREALPGMPSRVVGPSGSGTDAQALVDWATVVAGVGPARLRHAAAAGDPEGDAGRAVAARRVLDDVGRPMPAQADAWLAGVLAALSAHARSARVRYGLRATGRGEDDAFPVLVEWAPADLEETTLDSRDPRSGALPSTPGTPEDTALLAALEQETEDAVRVLRAADGLLDVVPLERSPRAAVRIAVDLVQAGRLSRQDALRRIDPRSLEAVLRPMVSPDAGREVIGQGVPASPGAASGRVVLNADEARRAAEAGESVVLVRAGTTPADVRAFGAASAVVTATGGQTSHAAVVARDRGVPCVVGVQDLHVDEGRGLFYLGDHVVRIGEALTVDGTSGEILLGQLETVAPPESDEALSTLLSWADEVASLAVYANADTEADASRARQLGAAGVGLCRTEHLFFKPEALGPMRRFLVAEDTRSRHEALAALAPAHRADLRALLQAMEGRPVTVRLLDPPLGAFLPTEPQDVVSLAEGLGLSRDRVAARVAELRETNPVLGLRGVRVGLVLPELYAMQVRAVLEAAADVVEAGGTVEPTLLVPMVASHTELARVRELLVVEAERVLDVRRVRVDYHLGAMIELPRACLRATALAREVDTFALGTNDLTQATWGMSRDDHGRYASVYLRDGVWAASPMMALDTSGVGELVKMAIERGRAGNRGLRVGACGEHAAVPEGVAFFHRLGVDHVSCSPFRVPMARLAAAQAALS